LVGDPCRGSANPHVASTIAYRHARYAYAGSTTTMQHIHPQAAILRQTMYKLCKIHNDPNALSHGLKYTLYAHG
jgi:hypothetical protein